MGESPKVLIQCKLPREITRRFAGVRGRVVDAAKASPRSVSSEAAYRQVQRSLASTQSKP